MRSPALLILLLPFLISASESQKLFTVQNRFDTPRLTSLPEVGERFVVQGQSAKAKLPDYSLTFSEGAVGLRIAGNAFFLQEGLIEIEDLSRPAEEPLLLHFSRGELTLRSSCTLVLRPDGELRVYNPTGSEGCLEIFIDGQKVILPANRVFASEGERILVLRPLRQPFYARTHLPSGIDRLSLECQIEKSSTTGGRSLGRALFKGDAFDAASGELLRTRQLARRFGSSRLAP
ncbi:MAG: hypothetical protein HQL31_07085 [Planctomycetes bacterium]|nr:hypothetical protein [Planctomycetota bacterium]